MIYRKLQEAALKRPEKIAVSCSERRITFRELLALVECLSLRMEKSGVGKSDEILLCLPNSIEFILCFYALAKLKAKIIPINHRVRDSEIRLYVRQRLPDVVIAHKSVSERFASLLPDKVRIIVPGYSEEVFGDPELPPLQTEEKTKKKREAFGGDFVVLFSSGSTGYPKKMCRSQESYIHEMNGFIEATGLSDNDAILAAIPLYHSHGIGSCLLPAIGSNCRLILLEDIPTKDGSAPVLFARRLSELAYLIRSEKATILPLIPYMLQTMLESGDFNGEAMRSVRLCFSSGNFLDEKTYRMFLEKFQLPILQIYGCSEAGAIAINGSPENNLPWNASGPPLSHVELIVRKEDFSICGPGEIGEVTFQSESLISGYIGEPELNELAFQNGCFSSGDLGFLDENGALTLTGRKKRLIDTGGNKVDPLEVEALLKSHPKIKDAVVVGVESTSSGEVVKAVLTNHSLCSSKEITDFCARNAASFKVPKIIEFRDEIPRTPTGKILMKELIFSEPSRKRTERLFIKILRAGLGVESSSAPFSNSEIDSINIVELNHYMADHFPNLSKTILFEYQTPEALVGYFKKSHSEVFFNYLKEKGIPHVEMPDATPVKRFKKSSRKDEGIAVIGISCVFPGSPDKEFFWKNLIEGKDLITEIPKERWNWRDYDGDPSREGNKTDVKWGGFIEDMNAFDARFFSISNHEAELMDPQQRLLLQNSWHAIEDAGYNPLSFQGNSIGMFVGVMTGDYEELVRGREVMAHTSIGISRAVCANRVSYFLGLEGPSVSVDTACSSSLTAIHQAIAAIRNEDCSQALVAGVNALITPALTISLSQAGMLSKDGRCKTFDQSANGYVRSEGCGVILLKPLPEALKDKDHIYGVIKGSAINHGGKVRSMTTPNPGALSNAIVSAHQKSNIPFQTLTCVEVNGTGTALGDPTEVSALGSAFSRLSREEKPERPYCGLTCVKTNVGHLESASGMAGLIKVLLAFQYKTLPGNPHFKKQNPNIEMDNTPFYIAKKNSPWKRLTRKNGSSIPRRAGVSSFGFGGANAYLLVEEYQPPDHSLESSEGDLELILLSARSKEQLLELSERLHNFLEQHLDISLKSIAFTLQTGRAFFESRLACVSRTPGELRTQLQNFSERRQSNSELNYWLGTAKRQNKREVKKAEDFPVKEIVSLWTGGVDFDFIGWYENNPLHKISLPLYPFKKTIFRLSISHSSQAEDTSAENMTRKGGVLKPLVEINPKSETSAVNRKIAIVGLDFHFPQSPDKDSFWELLSRKKVAISEVPESRWDWREYWGDPDKETNKTQVKWGGFIEDIDKFDHPFFKMSPREAIFMEPHQRLLLQSCWHAFEDAGYNPDQFAGEGVGVFVGAGAAMFGYIDILTRHSGVDAYTATGNCFSVLANRLSWFFDLRGPSQSIDTACASSFSAMNTAVKSIQHGECEAAVVASAAINDNPFDFIAFDQPGMLSRTGRIKPFDQDANGYVRGEGYGAMILKRLNDAIEDGDHIYGVVRGMEVNHTGKVSSMTVPGSQTQSELISSVCMNTNTPPDTINYVETHGTGTSVGDPIEIKGLKKAWEKMRRHFGLPALPEQYCALGAVKANIGHLEPTSGFAGLSKVLLAFQHKKIPAHPSLNKLNPECELDNSPFFINTELKEWRPAFDQNGEPLPRRAIVNNYGFGGANASLLLEEYQDRPKPVQESKEDLLFLFSAREPAQLSETVRKFLEYLRKNETEDRLHDIAYTLQAGRRGMASRLAVIADNRASLIDKLFRFLQNDLDQEVFCNTDVNRAKAPPPGSDSLTALINEENGADFLATHLIRGKSWKRLALLWIKGLDIQWAKGYSKGERKRIPLPVYPFEKKSCWYKKLIETKETNCFFDEVSSSGPEKLFEKLLSGQEFYLEDHRFKGDRILPAAMQLELVRLALREGNFSDVGITIRNAVWMKPIIVNAPLKLQVSLSPDAGDSLAFKIFSTTANGKEELYSKGKAVLQTPPSPEDRDLFFISRQSPHSKDVRELYREFQSDQSLFYGPSFQVIDSLKYGSGECLALLRHKGTPSELKLHKLHPALLDGAFQALKAITGDDRDQREFLPFSVDRFHFFAPLESSCQAHIEKSEEHKDSRAFHIHVMNEAGKVLAHMENFRLMTFTKPVEESFHLYKSVWRNKPLEEDADAEQKTLLFFGDNDQLAGLLDFQDFYLVKQGKAYEFSDTKHAIVLNSSDPEDFERLFQELKQKDKRVSHIIYQWDERGMEKLSLEDGADHVSAISAKLLWLAKSIIPQSLKSSVSLISLSYIQGEETDRFHETMAAFWRSVSLESPNFQYKSLLLKNVDLEEAARLLRNELGNSDSEVKYETGQRSAKELWSVPVNSMPDTRKNHLKKGGTYLITGGLGAIGLELAGYLTEKYQAKLLLTDRVKPGDEHQTKLNSLSMKGGEVEYIEGDIISAAHASDIIRIIENKYQKCDGIFHCAGMIRDAGCLKKTLREMEEVSFPKVIGSLTVQRIAESCRSSFVVCFSSLTSVLGNAGQADYAFANRFMDSNAQFLNRQNGETRWFSIQWSLWEKGGMSMPKENLRYLSRRFGIVPLSSKSALESLEYCLNHDLTQVAVLQGEQRKINDYLEAPENTDPLSISGRRKKITEILSGILSIDADEFDPQENLSRYGVDLIHISELSEKIEETFHVRLSDDILITYPSINTLTKHLAFSLGESGPVFEQAVPQKPAKAIMPAAETKTQKAVDEEIRNKDLSGSIQDFVFKICSEELKIESDELDVDTDFSEYGVDSIMMARIASKLEEAYSIELNPAVFINHPTIQQLVDYLVVEIQQANA